MEEEIENMALVRAVDEHENEHDKVDREYFDRLPPGVRFKPTGKQLIEDYLKKKVSNLPLPINRIRDVNLYNFHPHQLANMYKLHRERERYFFTPRDRKYPNGRRPDRSAGNGYWKATGADTKILSNGVMVGKKKSLVYYERKSNDKNGRKTEWIMHEYRIATEDENDNNNGVGPNRRAPNDMKLDDWVLCTMYKKEKLPKEQDQGNQPNDLLEEENDAGIDVQVANTVNVPELNEQVPSQNHLVQWLDFNHWANAPVNVPEQGLTYNAGHGEGVNNTMNVPELNEQVPSQNHLVQWLDFNHWANAPVVNQQVLNQTPIQEPQFNHGDTRFLRGHLVYNYNQFGPVNTLPYEPNLSVPNNLEEPVDNHWANAPIVNQQVLNQTPIQELQFNHGNTRFTPGHHVYNNNQFGPVNTLPYEPNLSVQNNLEEPVEILDYPPPLDYKENVCQDYDNGVWKTD